MLNQFTKLIDVKSIVTFCVVGTLCALAIRQNVAVPSELLAAVISSITTYFFTKKGSEEISKHDEQEG